VRVVHRRIPILLYHAVAPDTDGPLAPWVVAPEVFAEHLDVLRAEGARPVTISELVAMVHDRGEVPPRGTIAITFDDGFADFAEHAWPALAARDLRATLYVTTGYLGDRARWLPGAAPARPMLSASAVAALADEGVEIGAHTVHHPQLDLVPLAEARQEIVAGRERLAEIVGDDIGSFAYPHGYHGRRVRDLVARAGFHSACAVKHALSSTADDRFALARVMVRHGDGADRIRAWVGGTGLATAAVGREELTTKAWRQYRRVRARVGRAA
jgi:peptidoglycan/xylan/chitin deacetylase (PgdA/CDA1 family)